MYFVLALVVAIIAITPVLFVLIKRDSRNGSSSSIVGGLILAVMYLFINWLLFYCVNPSTAYVMFGFIGFIAMAEMFLTAVIMHGISDGEMAVQYSLPSVILVMYVFLNISSCEMFNASEYASLAGSIESQGMSEWAKENKVIDENNIRLVPESLAIANASLVMNNGTAIGSSYELMKDCITLQRIKDKYFYLIPLGYKDLGRWSSLDSISGYVKVSATDPFAKAQFIENQKMRYSPSAFFAQYLERHIYRNGYSSYIIEDPMFEEDDQGRTYWVVPVSRPTIGSFGKKVAGLLLIEPESGNISFYNNDNVPEWVDRVVPEHVVKQNLDYWGSLKNGWWNSVWTGTNLMETESPVLNYTASGKCMFVTPMTSNNRADNTMIGIVYTDARSGKSTFYKVKGGATEEAITTAVNAEIAFMRWHASSQMVYENIFGNLSALVPIMSEGGNYQGLAIVDTQTKRVAYAPTPRESLRLFEEKMSSVSAELDAAAEAKELSIESVVSRIGWDINNGRKQYYFLLSSSKNLFIGTATAMTVTSVGDRVSVRYMSNSKDPVPVVSFKNLTIGK